MALAPKWLDEVVKDCRDVDSVLAAIVKSAKLRVAVAEGIKEAEASEARNETEPVCGPSYEQIVRCAIVDAIAK